MFDFGLRLRNALRLPAAAVVIVLAGDSGEHIEHHRIERTEHAPGEVVGRTRQHPTCRKIERNDTDLLGVKIGAELLLIGRREAREAVDLLDEQHVVGPGDRIELPRGATP
jgi:hypothetical protein